LHVLDLDALPPVRTREENVSGCRVLQVGDFHGDGRAHDAFLHGGLDARVAHQLEAILDERVALP